MCFHPVSVPVYTYEPRSDLEFHDGVKYYKRNLYKVKHYKLVPCGKCAQCLAEQQKQWAFRIENEAIYGGHSAIYFVTLTYAPKFLPEGNTLLKEHVKRYVHDLRQLIAAKYGPNQNPLKYYFCGEYGSRYGRAHYHAILFFRHPIDWLLIQKAWGKGIVDILPFLPARAGYVAKYSLKQIGQFYDGKQAPFRLVSNGLGKCYIDGKDISSFHYSSFVQNHSGYKLKMPRYYLDKLISERNRWRSEYEFAGQTIVSNRSRTIQTFRGIIYSRKNLLDYYKRDDLARLKFGVNSGSYDQWLISRQNQLEHVYKIRQDVINYKYNFE